MGFWEMGGIQVMGGSFWNGELDTPLQTMCILHVNSSNRIFCSIHDLNFIMADKKM